MQADAEPAGSRVCTKSAQMQGARRRSNARSVRRGAQRRSWALFVQTLRGVAWRGPPQRPRQGNGAAQAGHTIALPGLASLRLRLARSPALLRALRIVMLFVCGSRRASRPAKQRRGPMGFCISLLDAIQGPVFERGQACAQPVCGLRACASFGQICGLRAVSRSWTSATTVGVSGKKSPWSQP